MKRNLIYIKKWKITKKNYTGSNHNLAFNYNLKSLNNTTLSENLFSTISFFLNKIYKKKADFNLKINKNQLVSLKSLGLRMGKGKGKKKKKIFLVNKGDFFLSIKKSSLRSKKDFKLFNTNLKKKLPFHTQTFYRLDTYTSL